ncbi:MAG: type II toxin-antitoxin system RelE/ParE family toxin [Bacillota bacterium]
MAKYNVELTEIAENDLLEIVKHITFQHSIPSSAHELMRIFEEAMRSLSISPERCPLIADQRLSQLGYRKLIVKNYIFFFSINDKESIVDVERILYAKRDWLRFL